MKSWRVGIGIVHRPVCRLMSCMSIHLPHDAIRVTVFFGGCSDSTMSFSATE
ncbi:hypothetical protein CE10_1036 [Escherichia coli O7:K1 str. CE10]|nr:hypothetical protein CE10_1036 [Escherichia coli O7:K1 str. CE10]